MTSDSPIPKVSIGIPTRNRVAYLRLAVESALAQTYSNLEVVVSDNASDDATLEYLASVPDPRLRILRQEKDLGMVGNFNACLFAATGDLFLLLSDDDLLDPSAVEALSAPFRSADGDRIGLSWCPSTIIDADGKAMWITEAGPASEAPTELLVGLYNGRRGPRLPAIMVRRTDSMDLGGYDELRHNVMCDMGNWGRIALRYEAICCILESLVKYRVHPASLTHVANCADWQLYGHKTHGDFLCVLKEAGKPAEAECLARAFPNFLANITITVLLRFVRRPGWVSLFAREFWRSRRFMLTPFVAGRLLRDGWKLLRV